MDRGSANAPQNCVKPWLSVTALILGAVSVLTAQEQSLAEAANQEEARRRAVSQPSKVYTNADVMPDTFSRLPSSIPATLCSTCPGDSEDRIHRSEAARRAFLQKTGYPDGRPGWIVDHTIPLACGGADDPSNMRWQTEEEARAKDKIERRKCDDTMLDR
jgi:hypothetical protein